MTAPTSTDTFAKPPPHRREDNRYPHLLLKK
jgi:hypothetical protein